MAAPKKTTTKSKEKEPAKTSEAKTPAKAPADQVQVVFDTVRGFQMNTLFAMGLGVALLIFLIIPELRYVWWLNIFTAAASGYLFWSQSTQTEGVEQKVCRWGLLSVALMVLGRDVWISNELAEMVDRYGEIDNVLS